MNAVKKASKSKGSVGLAVYWHHGRGHSGPYTAETLMLPYVQPIAVGVDMSQRVARAGDMLLLINIITENLRPGFVPVFRDNAGIHRQKILSNLADPPIIGLALGSGASRGWSHVGVIKALLREGIEPGIVCGTSVGAMVGGSYVAGNLDKLESWVLESTRSDVLRFFDLKFSQAGFVNVERMRRFLRSYVGAEDVLVEELPKKYVAVAADLDTGREFWFREGELAHAVRASMAMPGLFPAVRHNGRWMVDGGLVNPVPVSACRALGADIVIGVNLNSDIVGRRIRKAPVSRAPEEGGVLDNLKKQARQYSSSLFPQNDEKEEPLGLIGAVSSSINIFQDRITRSRLAGDPADVMISPKLGNMGILEFSRAAEAMQEGEECVQMALPEIHRAVGT